MFDLIDCTSVNPGNVTIRRLTRYEYRNSIRSIFGIDYSTAASFPGDDVGYGFDNIADVLSLPPLLLEKYLDAAEEITQRTIFDPSILAVDVDLSAVNFKFDSSKGVPDDGSVLLFTEGDIRKSFYFPEVGMYALAVDAYGDQAGKEDVRMTCHVDGQVIKTVAVKSTRRKPSRHVFAIPIYKTGEKKISLSFDNDFYAVGSDGKQDRNLIIKGVLIKGPKRSKSSKSYLNFAQTNRAAAIGYLDALLLRAFRSPVSKDERQRLIGLYDQGRKQGLSFYQSLRQVTQAILISPKFLYRFEAPVSSGDVRSLNDFERATALSYFLWSSTPDDKLLRAAGDSTLSDPAVWKAHVTRLLKDGRSRALVDNFVDQWLNLRVLADVQPDTDLFPDVNSSLMADMASETRMVVSDVFRRDGSILELLDCDFTFVNEALSNHYQMEIDAVGSEFVKVKLPEERSGILTHASILTLTSNPDRTSPVKRGKWLLENFLGEEPPPPVDSITPLEDQKELVGSLRQRMLQHRADPACASCHAKMDALGFSLENYDAVGRFRLKDAGFEIDANSEMPDGVELHGASGLQRQLKTAYRDDFVHCFTEKLLTYALGRGLKYYDRCTVDQVIEHAAKNNYRLSAFIFAIVNSDTFLKRSGKTTLFTGIAR